MAKILIVDDEERMRTLLADFLRREGHEIREAGNGIDALRLYDADGGIDLVLLDVMMPEMDGYETAKFLRERGNTPILMLTARNEERDELKGFAAGVDDYVTKPFSPRTLIARVDALLRRSKGAGSPILEIGGVRLDRSAHQVLVEGEPIELSHREFELLAFFMENPGRVFDRESLVSSVWGYDYDGDDRTVDTHVRKLRSKLGSAQDHLITVWGVGYKFV